MSDPGQKTETQREYEKDKPAPKSDYDDEEVQKEPKSK